MDYYFLKPNSTANSQTIPDESVPCIAVKEDRQQNIMNSVVLKKGIEDFLASDRVARFINSSGYKEITLKSDTEPGIIAFRNRVAENCNAEFASEDAVKGDRPSNGLVENAVMLLRRVIRTIKCHVERCTQEELREDSQIAWQEANTRVCAIRGEGAGETDIHRTFEQNKSQITSLECGWE